MSTTPTTTPNALDLLRAELATHQAEFSAENIASRRSYWELADGNLPGAHIMPPIRPLLLSTKTERGYDRRVIALSESGAWLLPDFYDTKNIPTATYYTWGELEKYAVHKSAQWLGVPPVITGGHRTDIRFLVEANSNERHNLWAQYAHNGPWAELQALIPEDERPKYLTRPSVHWEQISEGYHQTIGTYTADGKELPLVVSFNFARINGVVVCFYYITSELALHSKVGEYLRECFPIFHDAKSRWSHVDAMNFHNCLIPIRDGEIRPNR